MQPPQNFSLSPQNQKESNLSHLGDLSDILRGHFDGGGEEGTTLPGARVSHQRQVRRVVATPVVDFVNVRCVVRYRDFTWKKFKLIVMLRWVKR